MPIYRNVGPVCGAGTDRPKKQTKKWNVETKTSAIEVTHQRKVTHKTIRNLWISSEQHKHTKFSFEQLRYCEANIKKQWPGENRQTARLSERNVWKGKLICNITSWQRNKTKPQQTRRERGRGSGMKTEYEPLESWRWRKIRRNEAKNTNVRTSRQTVWALQPCDHQVEMKTTSEPQRWTNEMNSRKKEPESASEIAKCKYHFQENQTIFMRRYNYYFTFRLIHRSQPSSHRSGKC